MTNPTKGEEESDWIEAVVAQLRNAKREAKKVTKAKADVRAIEENRRSANVGLMGDIGSEISQAVPAGAGSGSGEVGDGGAGTADAEKEVPEWIVQQLPGLLDTLEACRHLVHVSWLNCGRVGRGDVCKNNERILISRLVYPLIGRIYECRLSIFQYL